RSFLQRPGTARRRRATNQPRHLAPSRSDERAVSRGGGDQGERNVRILEFAGQPEGAGAVPAWLIIEGHPGAVRVSSAPNAEPFLSRRVGVLRPGGSWPPHISPPSSDPWNVEPDASCVQKSGGEFSGRARCP